MSDEPTRLQMLLRALYFKAWKNRNGAQMRVNQLLFELQAARDSADEHQRHLEGVAEELTASGYTNASAYLERVWPLSRPGEKAVDSENCAVSEITA